ncbi:MAG: heparan-alpha-glucosaminide N-acetyltransferase domain-containing protein [Bryobacteraceae bacterium]
MDRISVEPEFGVPDRVLSLDWLRGLGVLIMLQGHTFNSFARPNLQNHPVYILSQFVGGLPAPIFLFLVGATLAFRLDRADRAGLDPAARVRFALRRALFLAAIAFLFRLQLWIFSWGNPWQEIFRVDILNCMALAVLALSPLALAAPPRRVNWGLAAGLIVASIAPLINESDWSGVPWIIRNYVLPNKAFFSFFPGAAYTAFGFSFGALLRCSPKSARDRIMQWTACLGLGVILTAHYFSNLPFSIYPHSDFWLNSPGLILIRTGIVLVLAAVGFVWTARQSAATLSFMRTLGTNSLLIYWVHVELVYGRWFPKEWMTIGQCCLASLLLVAMMYGLARLRLPDRIRTRLSKRGAGTALAGTAWPR